MVIAFSSILWLINWGGRERLQERRGLKNYDAIIERPPTSKLIILGIGKVAGW